MVLPASPSRQLLVWSLPTVAFVLSILWYRRRLRGSKRQTDPGGTLDSTTSVDTAVVPAAESCAQQEEHIEPSKSVAEAANFLTVSEKEVEVISSPHLSNLSVPNLCEVILTQNEIKSSHTELGITEDNNISIENIVLISSKTTELKSECTKVKEAENSAISLKEEVVFEEPEEKQDSLKVIEQDEEDKATSSVATDNYITSKVIEIDGTGSLSAGGDQEPVINKVLNIKQETQTEMTEVEEPNAVAIKGSMLESSEAIAPSSVLENISVDVTVSETKTSATDNSSKTPVHQPRDSANHSPAEAMLASPSISNDSDTHSVGSNDSGKGGSDVTTPVIEEENQDGAKGSGKSSGRAGSSRRTSTSSRSSGCPDTALTMRLHPTINIGSSTSIMEQQALQALHSKQPCVYEFVIPQQLVGRLIGKHGCFVQQINSETNSNIFVKRHPESPKFKVCAIEGTQDDIDEALKLIRKKFPVKKYPLVTLERVVFLPTSGSFPMIPESLQMYLVEGVNNDVILSSLVNASHMFLQQPTHPTFPVLSRLIMTMTQCYTEDDSPTLPNPSPGIVCAAPSMGGWYRAEVMEVRPEVLTGEEKETQAGERTVCDIKFVDYGGFMTLPTSELRQIRTDFMLLPFQATECYLADVTWLEGEESWSEKATQCVEELTRDQVLQAQVVGYTDDSTPLIRLFSSMHGTMAAVMINEILVHRGLAKI